MKTLCMTLALAGAMVAFTGPVRSQDVEQKSAPPSEKTAEIKEMEGAACPVLGGPIDKKYSYTYKGTRYYFCCPVCIGKFKADPEKYIEKMPKGK